MITVTVCSFGFPSVASLAICHVSLLLAMGDKIMEQAERQKEKE